MFVHAELFRLVSRWIQDTKASVSNFMRQPRIHTSKRIRICMCTCIAYRSINSKTEGNVIQQALINKTVLMNIIQTTVEMCYTLYEPRNSFLKVFF